MTTIVEQLSAYATALRYEDLPSEVVRYYSEINVDRLHADGEQLLKPLRLSAQETDDLIVFVESLTDFRTNWKRSKGGEPTCK